MNKISCTRTITILVDLNIWDIGFDSDKFTFIDLIKGIIPLSLYEKITVLGENNGDQFF